MREKEQPENRSVLLATPGLLVGAGACSGTIKYGRGYERPVFVGDVETLVAPGRMQRHQGRPITSLSLPSKAVTGGNIWRGVVALTG